MKTIKKFLVENGFTSLLVLAAAVVLFVLGFKIFGAIALGFFGGRNWEIIRSLYAEHVKGKVKL